MKKCFILALVCSVAVLAAFESRAGEWVTAQSYYSHDPQTGQRVQQYAPIGPFYPQPQGNYQRSGYHHTRSSIQVGTSADNYHIVEEFGAPVRPYGEWRFPFRPYSVPAHLSTPPFIGGRGYGGYYGGRLPGGGVGGSIPGRPIPGRPIPGRPIPGAGLVPPPAGPGSGVGQPGASLFDLYPEREGHHIPFNTPDPYQTEKLLPSDSPRLPRPGAS